MSEPTLLELKTLFETHINTVIAKLQQIEVTDKTVLANKISTKGVIATPDMSAQQMAEKIDELVSRFPGDLVKKYLYNKGDECIADSGGFITSIYGWSTSIGTGTAPTITRNAQSMKLYLNANGATRSGSVFPVNKITMGTYKRLCIQVKSDIPTIQYGMMYCCLTQANPASANYVVPHIVYTPNTAGNGEYIATFDISALTGDWYLTFSLIAFYISSVSYTVDCSIEKIWLE